MAYFELFGAPASKVKLRDYAGFRFLDMRPLRPARGYVEYLINNTLFASTSWPSVELSGVQFRLALILIQEGGGAWGTAGECRSVGWGADSFSNGNSPRSLTESDIRTYDGTSLSDADKSALVILGRQLARELEPFPLSAVLARLNGGPGLRNLVLS